MEARIAVVQKACVECSARDLLVAAALAQNGGITPETMRQLSMLKGDVDWVSFFREDWPSSNMQLDAQIRQELTGMDYQRSFMLYRFIRNIRVLHQRGWDLPDGITEEDLDDLENFALNNNAME